MQVRYNEIISDPAFLDEVLADGARKASSIADVTVNNLYQAMGFFRRWNKIEPSWKIFKNKHINATTTTTLVTSRCP